MVAGEAGVDVSFVWREGCPSVFEEAGVTSFLESSDVSSREVDHSGVNVHELGL